MHEVDRGSKVPADVLEAIDWAEIAERITGFAFARLRHTSIEDAKQIANDALRTLLDPESEVAWEWEQDPDPIQKLGSIVNGLVSNRYRRKSVAKRHGDEVGRHMGGGESLAESNPEASTIARDLFRKVLNHVYEHSVDDELVQQMVLLANDGILDVEEQESSLKVPRPRLYEARRRLHERIEAARLEIEEET